MNELADLPAAGSFDSLDLLLLHHYITCISLDLVGPKQAYTVWQDIVPRQAHAYPLLFHGILALAGMHLAIKYMTPGANPVGSAGRKLSNKYRVRALVHRHKGLRQFHRALDSKLEVNQEQMPCLLRFNCMLIISAFAIPLTDEESSVSIEDVLMVFQLCRGGYELYQSSRDPWREQSTQGVIFAEDSRATHRFSTTAEGSMNGCMARQDRPVIRASLEGLMLSQSWAYKSGVDLRLLSSWPSLCSDEFVEELKQRTPDSLDVLAQYSHVLAICRDRWWVGSWPQLLLRAIDGCLSEEAKMRMRWNIEDNLAGLESEHSAIDKSSSC
ncbi:uncharacterized protein RHO25_010253 [Cercospora beticola]|uniref:Transcription factor domain-containing protein n=1 Tax=Cercospora beticola TaxID=122368 RepID=A0ABZ0P1D9_CERBT|nr:hypothetical protein RHO25_010253 [Cercospora beticola]CAK1365434.1 unnamed protein product [Cercospora beticola]